MQKSTEDTLKFINLAAVHHQWLVNPDTALTEAVAEGLTANFNRLGYYACPCRESWGERQKDRDICCPCVYSAKDIAEYGQCYCGLFISQNFADSGKAAESIPERRPAELTP